MDFAVLPPEVNSARMYAGAGAGPMLAAAAAWDALAAELHSLAGSYESVVGGLTAGPWVGRSSMSMAAAAASYVAWTRNTATQAEQAANQAIAAAVAYETAFAETVPPPVVTANRALLAALVATNLFGQNTPAIAATEAQYAEMWAQDASAMYGYAGSSASATTLTPFASPPATTSPNGLSSQAAATALTTAAMAGNVQNSVSTVPQALSAVPNTLNSLAAPAATIPSLTPLELLDLLADLSGLFIDPEIGAAGLGVDSFVGITALPYDIIGYVIGVHTDDIVSGWAGLESWPGTALVPPKPFPAPITSLGGSAVSAGLAEANTIGGLSVPPTWTDLAPGIHPLAVSLPATTVGPAAEMTAGAAGSLFSQMALAGVAGRAIAGTGGAARRERAAAATSERPTPSTTNEQPTPPTRAAGGPITSIAAELRELASLRDSGILTEEEFTEQKQRLLPH
ncbi:putative PPE family protein PPE29 [Mycobacterium basiliense]|uniref:Putative PPE family protein PPE29 n=1 Tax=Mycobacterium basiliense TaxID=2094119 RepID=A0A3S4BIT6_9MYCO|nr:PPE domain-containing protein [Mycobacterium basiliense]VDM89140.1 putative PPE family protein PPE29 [Mycobacterium basiliense]